MLNFIITDTNLLATKVMIIWIDQVRRIAEEKKKSVSLRLPYIMMHADEIPVIPEAPVNVQIQRDRKLKWLFKKAEMDSEKGNIIL